MEIKKRKCVNKWEWYFWCDPKHSFKWKILKYNILMKNKVWSEVLNLKIRSKNGLNSITFHTTVKWLIFPFLLSATC